MAVSGTSSSALPGMQALAKDEAHATPMATILYKLQRLNHFVVVSHARPDGDAIGSILAMESLLRHMGKSAEMVMADAVPSIYRSLPGADRIYQTRLIDSDKYGAAIILECDSTQRTGVEGLDALFVINIDHHRTGREYGALNWIDPDASAVAVMVYHLALAAGAAITPAMATCLYTALMTDTGSFTYPGTSADTFTLAHALIDLGAKADAVARDVLYSVPAARIHLLGLALSRMQIQGPVAWTYVTQDDLMQLCATDEDSEGTVNYLISIAEVQAAAFLREIPGEPHQFRTSLRSKSSVDVSRVASFFEGGGHRNAAGCTVTGPLERAVEHILLELNKEVQHAEADLLGVPVSEPDAVILSGQL